MKQFKVITITFFTITFFVALPLIAQQEQGAAGEQQPQNQFVDLANPAPLPDLPPELISEEQNLQSLSEEQRQARNRNTEAEELWKNADYRDYSEDFARLYRFSPAFTNDKYRMAISNYQAGISTIIKMRNDTEMVRYERETLPQRMVEKWYWQIVDRRAQTERIVGRKRRTAKISAVTYLSRAINDMDDIPKHLHDNPAYRQLLSAIYRSWVIHQFDLGNLPQCIPVLEQYIEIDDNEREYPAHRYLYQSYAFQEKLLENHNAGTEAEILHFRRRKNVHLLRAAELKYSKDSPEYREIIEVVNRDEIVPIQP